MEDGGLSPRHLVFKLLVKIQIEGLSLTSRDWNKELDLRSLSLVLWIQELDALCGLSWQTWDKRGNH